MTNEQSLRKHLADVLDWGNAHITFDDAMKDFPAAGRGVRPGNAPHSAWELLEHLRIAIEDILEYTRDEKHPSPEFPAGYWPPSPEPPSDAAWEESAAAYRRHLRDFAALVSDESTDLFKPNSDGKTPLREVLLAADHNAYHLGQLMMVRRLL